jgi:probable metal-binding protein
MENVIHAHEVLHMVGEAADGIMLEDLRTELQQKFGPEVRFTNCADAMFTVDELLVFLQARGKISVNGGLARVNAQNVCSH